MSPSDVLSILVLVAALLAVTALLVVLATWLVERRNPPAGDFLEIDGVRLHYVDRGSGPPVVFLHGNASLMQDFLISPTCDRIAAAHRVIVIDRPGYGYSTRPRDRVWTPAAQAHVIAGALERLGCAPAVVVGHSWGVLPALALAMQRPDGVRSLVLLAGYYYPLPRADVLIAATGTIPVLGTLLRYTITPLTGLLIMPLFLKALFAPAAVPERFRRSFPWAMLLRPRQLRASLADGAMMTSAAAALSGSYRSIRSETVIVAGDGDRIVDPGKHSAPLSADMPNASLEMVPGAGHMIQHLAPEVVTRAIRHAAAATVAG